MEPLNTGGSVDGYAKGRCTTLGIAHHHGIGTGGPGAEHTTGLEGAAIHGVFVGRGATTAGYGKGTGAVAITIHVGFYRQVKSKERRFSNNYIYSHGTVVGVFYRYRIGACRQCGAGAAGLEGVGIKRILIRAGAACTLHGYTAGAKAVTV